MSSTTTTTNTGATEQNREPWAPSVPHLENIMNAGQTYYGGGIGANTWQGPDVAPINSQLSGALNDMWNTSNRNPAAPEDVYRSATGNIADSGITPGMQPGLDYYGGVMGGQRNADSNFRQIGNAAAAPSAAQTNLSGMAAGGGTNPYLTQMLDQGANRISDQVASSMSGSGRYGSFGHAGALNDRISEFQNPVLAQAYETDQNRRLQATGQIDAARQAATQAQLQGEAGWLGQYNQNTANQMQGATGLLSNQQQGAQRALGYSALAPELYNATYAPTEHRAAIGDYMQGRDQQSLQGARQQFEAQEAMPWTQLARYGAALGYVSPLAGQAGNISGTTSGTNVSDRPYGFMDYANLFAGGGNSAISGAGNAALGLSMMSDREAKTDIKKVGKSQTTGLPIFSYRYKGDPKNYPKVVGPMAQDIEKAVPGSTERIGGLLTVKPQYAGLLGAL